MLLHPIIVQFVIVLLAVAVVTDFLHLFTQQDKFQRLASWLLIGGVLAAIAAVVSGGQAFEIVEIPSGVKPLVRTHRSSGTLTMRIFIGVAAVRFLLIKFDLLRKPIRWGYYLLLIIAAAFLFRTATLGANMVNEHGVGVKKMEKQPIKKPDFNE